MFKYILPVVLLFGFVGCDEDELADLLDGAVDIPTGLYIAACEDNGDGTSQIEKLDLQANGNVVQTTDDYLLAADCTGTVTPDVNNDTITLAEEVLAENISYLTVADSGGPLYIPYHLEGANLSIGTVESDISAGAATVFAAFIADYVTETNVLYVKQ